MNEIRFNINKPIVKFREEIFEIRTKIARVETYILNSDDPLVSRRF